MYNGIVYSKDITKLNKAFRMLEYFKTSMYLH